MAIVEPITPTSSITETEIQCLIGTELNHSTVVVARRLVETQQHSLIAKGFVVPGKFGNHGVTVARRVVEKESVGVIRMHRDRQKSPLAIVPNLLPNVEDRRLENIGAIE